jgi:hypothetical protein
MRQFKNDGMPAAKPKVRLKKGGLVRKTNVLVKVPKDYCEDALGIVADTDEIGKFGEYTDVMSVWDTITRYGEHRTIWTFCDEYFGADVKNIFRKGLPKGSEIDLLDGRVLMLKKYDPDIEDPVIGGENRKINVMVDAPWGDVTKIKECIINSGEIGVCGDHGRIITLRADGYFTPLEGSDPMRGKTGTREKVVYRKIWTCYNSRDEGRILRKLRMAARSYELPVICFYEDPQDRLLTYMSGADFKTHIWNIEK